VGLNWYGWMALDFLEEAGTNLLPKLIHRRPRKFAGVLLAWKVD